MSAAPSQSSRSGQRYERRPPLDCCRDDARKAITLYTSVYDARLYCLQWLLRQDTSLTHEHQGALEVVQIGHIYLKRR